MRLVLAALVLLALAAPALAQTQAVPITGTYSEVYVIGGRALDSRGLPLSGATVVIELEQRGVEAEPLRAAANCKGDFITSFTLRHVEPQGKATISVLNQDGSRRDPVTISLDPFYRRSDAIVRYTDEWSAVCASETNVWPVSASLTVRLLNRTDIYLDGGEEYHAVPYSGIIRLRYEAPDGNTVCPPNPQNPAFCELFQADARGDVRYTFTLDKEFDGGGRAEVILQDNTTISVPIDAGTRLGVKYVEVTGRGVPPELYDTPGLPIAAVLACIGLLAILRRR